MSCFRVFGVFRSSLLFGDKSEYVVAAPQYRAAANTAMGWKKANLRSEMTRLLRCAGVSGWPRLFHSMRASRQTDLHELVCQRHMSTFPAIYNFEYIFNDA
jgi:hypothetical protein